MGDGFVLLLSMLKKLSDPQMMDLMNRVLDLPRELKLAEAKPLGPLAMLSAMGSKEARQGLGVALEFTKALGKLKTTHG
ncbi:MAG: DUF1641 domain-containing protein [Deltaproteobacteria bacterium]|nr:DUF1641 domain-containing protein [Deltaproteobacteria bacterium]